MERLTERFSNGQAAVYGCGNNCKHDFKYCETYNENCPTMVELYEKLADYEDAEEQGLLIRLPCKVGDTVYKVWYKPCHHGEDHPDSYGCCGCEDDCDLEKAVFEFVVPSLEWVLGHLRTFGESVWFLTREEAEVFKERIVAS